MATLDTILKYPISFRLIDPENMMAVPRRIDDGMYHLCAPKNIYIRFGQYREIPMGIVLHIPEQIKIPIGNTGVIVTQNLHCRIDTNYNILLGRGIQVLSPTVLSPAYDPVELRLYITSIKSGNHTINAGEPIATLQFTTTSPVILGINQELPIAGETSCATNRLSKKLSK